MIIFTNQKSAFRWFQEHNIIIVPTETVYGLSSQADDPVGINKIYALKNRPKTNPLILHFDSIAHIQKYCYMNELEYNLLKIYTPGPLTLLLKKKDKDFFSLATNNSDYICARIPNNKFTLNLIKKFGVIAAPSCNISGQLTITNIHMLQWVYHNIDIGIYEDDKSVQGIESTIIQVQDNNILILRSGLINIQEIQQNFPDINIQNNIKIDTQIPGNKFLHYQIKKPLYIKKYKSLDCFHIGIGDTMCDFNLSLHNNPQEIIKNYFYSLFLGDISLFPAVSIVPFEEQNIFDSIKIRLNKTLIK
jgi:L-threonylcarbamoyladenylate synthase